MKDYKKVQKIQNETDIFSLRTMDFVNLPGCCCLYLPWTCSSLCLSQSDAVAEEFCSATDLFGLS